MPKISRRKWQESIKCLKQAISNERLSWAVRLHSVELYMSLMGVPLPDSSNKSKKSIKLLVEERAGERTLHQHIRAEVADKVRQEAEQEEEREAQARSRRAMQDASDLLARLATASAVTAAQETVGTEG